VVALIVIAAVSPALAGRGPKFRFSATEFQLSKNNVRPDPLFPRGWERDRQWKFRAVSERNQSVGDLLIGFLPNMRRFGYSLARSQDKADDLVQAACERALLNAGSFEAGTRFDAWIFRIMRNLWIDQTRRARTAGPQDDIEDRHDLVGSDGEREAVARLTLNSVGEAIMALPDDQRELLLLVCVEELSYKEAAETLDIPIGTVMSRLARARKKLAESGGINPDAMRS
jgi:RNA polymerase sigma-70 factor, ECF subfamily